MSAERSPLTREEFERMRAQVEPIESVADVDRLALRNPQRYRELLDGYNTLLDQKPGAQRLVAKRLGDYVPEPVSWLWNQRIPRGKITVLAGDGGEGKSFATLGIAAAVTTGEALPGSNPSPPANVLMWNGEDGPSDTIHERATNAGADLHRISMVEDVTERGKRVPFSLQHLGLLTTHLKADPEIVLVVIDPITALLPNVDSHRDTDIRSALQPLAALAAEMKVAVLLVMHLNKGEHLSVLHRLSGSVAFGALARSVLFLGTHAISGRKAIDPIKHNLARGRPNPVEFSLGEEGFRWVGMAPELTAEAIRASQVRANKGARGEGAEDFLREFLRHGRRTSTEVYKAAHERGIADVTLRRAKEKLEIRATKHGIGEGSLWMWELPEASLAEVIPIQSKEQLQRSSRSALEDDLWEGMDMLAKYDGKGINES